jgi:hypothetical protein
MLAVLLTLRLATVGPDEADDLEGSRRFGELIDEAANRGEFASALRLIDEAETLYPHHRWHFFRAAILSETGDCEAAIPEYEAYLAEETLPANVASAEAGLGACEKQTVQAEPVASEPPPPSMAAPAPADPPTKPGPEPRGAGAWARDPTAIVLVTSGLVGVGVGAGLFIQGIRKRDEAESADDLGGFDSAFARAQRFHTAGIVTLALGGALVVGAAIRFGVVASRARRRRVVGLVPLRVRF